MPHAALQHVFCAGLLRRAVVLHTVRQKVQ